MSDLTEGEDGQRRLRPFGDLRIISDVNHHLQVGQPVNHLQDEVFHTAAPEDKGNKECSSKSHVNICFIIDLFIILDIGSVLFLVMENKLMTAVNCLQRGARILYSASFQLLAWKE